MKPSIWCAWGCAAPLLVHAFSQLVLAAEPLSSSRVKIVCSANMQGVLEPCGCQLAQGGGLTRRATQLHSLSDHGKYLLLDGGNLVNSLAPSQYVLKEARTLLKGMGYVAGTLGPAELGLGAASLQEAKHDPLPLVISNVWASSGAPIGPASVRVTAASIQFEVFGVIAPALVPKGFIARTPEEALCAPVRASASTRRVPILVAYQSIRSVRELLQSVPQIQIVFIHSQDAGQAPERCGNTWIIPVPISGRQLNEIDFTISPNSNVIPKITVVDIGPEVKPSEIIAAHLRQFSERQRVTGIQGVPSLSGKTIAQTQSLISDVTRECGSCHKKQEAQWIMTKHAHAWTTLRTGGAQQRAECVNCHTTPLLVASLGSTSGGVGCATCHGNGFLHIARPREKGLITRLPSQGVCAQCHTVDASPHFEYDKYLQNVTH
jgi:hypothetical protein